MDEMQREFRLNTVAELDDLLRKIADDMATAFALAQEIGDQAADSGVFDGSTNEGRLFQHVDEANATFKLSHRKIKQHIGRIRNRLLKDENNA